MQSNFNSYGMNECDAISGDPFFVIKNKKKANFVEILLASIWNSRTTELTYISSFLPYYPYYGENNDLFHFMDNHSSSYSYLKGHMKDVRKNK